MQIKIIILEIIGIIILETTVMKKTRMEGTINLPIKISKEIIGIIKVVDLTIIIEDHLMKKALIKT